MKKTRSHYNLEFKLKAVELSNTRGSLDEIAKELNISRESLRNWRRAFKEGKMSLTSNQKLRIQSKEELEIQQLKKELYHAQLERDILKKAVSIFSKSDK
jgi:transposase